MFFDQNGYEVVIWVKKQVLYLLFIFFSVKFLKVDKFKGFKFGVDDYIIKLIDEELFLVKVKVFIKCMEY